MTRRRERSVCFDTAAAYYDQTRSSPSHQVVKLPIDELSGRGRCLDIGVGTGRVALPLIEAGLDSSDSTSPFR
jgi:ubiquinone/menaquinone biosynthesis C-methylase UbiE